MGRATAETKPVLATATQLLEIALPAIWKRGGLTLLGCSVGNLDDDAAVQLALPFDRLTGGALDAAVDDVRERFGTLSVTRAGQLGRDSGLSVPMLPD
jgi:DNA polymerase-4